MARLGWLLGLLAPAVLQAQATARPAPQAFVQAFYDWYVPRALASDTAPAWSQLAATRPAALQPDLARALHADAAAQARSDEIVGLDGDPLLDSQDPCERYVAGRGMRVAHGYRVPVYAVCGGERTAEPSVIAELQPSQGTWQFVNFYYPGVARDDLRTLLRRLHTDRARSHQ